MAISRLSYSECEEESGWTVLPHHAENLTTIKWIDVSPSQNRKRRLRNHSKLVEIWEMNPDSTDIFEENLVDNFCPKRPDDMEEICLYDFVAEYGKCGVDGDFNGNAPNPLFPTTGYTIPPRRTSVRITTTLSFSCSFPFATRQTSSKSERLLRALLKGT
jgi:hypothetical protein